MICFIWNAFKMIFEAFYTSPVSRVFPLLLKHLLRKLAKVQIQVNYQRKETSPSRKNSQVTGFPTVPWPWLDQAVSNRKFTYCHLRFNGEWSQGNRWQKQRMWLELNDSLAAHKIVIPSQKVLLHWSWRDKTSGLWNTYQPLWIICLWQQTTDSVQ